MVIKYGSIQEHAFISIAQPETCFIVPAVFGLQTGIDDIIGWSYFGRGWCGIPPAYGCPPYKIIVDLIRCSHPWHQLRREIPVGIGCFSIGINIPEIVIIKVQTQRSFNMKTFVDIGQVTCEKKMLIGVDLIQRLGSIAYARPVAIIIDIRIGLLPFQAQVYFPVISVSGLPLQFKIGAQAIGTFVAVLIIGNKRICKIDIAAENRALHFLPGR